MFYREAFRCTDILDRFLAGEEPTVTEFKDALFLTERANDRSKPDAYYRDAFKVATGEWKTWRDVIRGTLEGLSTAFLERGGRRHICVRYDRFSEWQHVVPETSPLAVVTWRLVREFGPLPFDGPMSDLSGAIERHIMPQIRYSALPTVHDPRLDRLIGREGVDDLHVHLNGSSEMERVWLDALARPHSFIHTFRKGCSTKLVEEFLRQDEPGLTHEKFAMRVRAAARLHRLLVRLVVPALLQPHISCRRAGRKPKANAKADAIRWQSLFMPDHLGEEDLPLSFLPYPPGYSSESDKPLSLSDWPRVSKDHPMMNALPCFRGRKDISPLTAEAVLLAGAFQRLDDSDGEIIATALFVYLSLMCVFGRSIVQQRSQIGFDQFQKITINEVRESLETRTYVDRFHQVEYTAEGDIDVLEGRFAPKSRPADMRKILKLIGTSYDRYNGTKTRVWEELGPPTEDERDNRQQGRRINLYLIPHFVKKEDNRKVKACRHYMLRRTLRKQAAVLLTVMDDPYQYVPIVGFDAAANELHAPPEVFAPVFRFLRNKGYRNFTYHAGEDFRHMLSGIRAVSEAVTFLEMTPGNRIGHGSALGIDPKLWRRRIGETIALPRLEWLDNLVFARSVLMDEGEVAVATRLDADIARLSACVYGRSHGPEILHRAWQLRQLDPLIALGLDGPQEDALDPFFYREFDRVTDAEADSEVFDIWRAYHGNGAVDRGKELIIVGDRDTTDPFLPDILVQLQEATLRQLEERRIVLETLPTSNVRISYYEGHHEHHVLRWLGIVGERRPRVPVVVGSDDPGIFATNMRNEYAHLLRELENACPGGSREAVSVIEELIENGKRWRFRPAPS